MNKKLKKALKYWYVYALAIGAASIGSVYYCDFINRPKNEETISLFISSYSSSTSEISSYLWDKSPDYLRNISVFCINPMSADFDYYMVNKGLNQADIFILKESYLFDRLIEGQFAQLKDETIKEYLPSYSTDESGKGILFHSIGDGGNGLIDVVDDRYEDDNFYVFYRVNSLHIGGLNDSKADTALRFTKALLEYE